MSLILVGILLLMLCGVPFFALIGGVALLGFHTAGYDLTGVANEFARLGSMHELLPIPLSVCWIFRASSGRAAAYEGDM